MKSIRLIEDLYGVRLDTIGDGSCLLHAIFQGFNSYYCELKQDKKSEFIREFRHVLSLHLDVDKNYENLSRGQIQEISKFVPEMSKTNMKNYLNSRNWLNIFFIEYISEILDLDIYILDSHTKKIYKTGDNEIYFKNRKSVIIYYIRDLHFETIGIETPDGIKTLFSHDCYIIEKLKNLFI